MDFSIIVATDKNNGIGLKEGTKYSIPWKSKEDLIFFKKITTQGEKNALIVGRNTYFSLPKNKDNIPFLKDRMLLVLTSKPCMIPKHDLVAPMTNFQTALEFAKFHHYDNVLAIGGVGVYEEALTNENLVGIYWNEILKTDKKCNIFFPLDRQNPNSKITLVTVKSNFDLESNIKYNHYSYYRTQEYTKIVNLNEAVYLQLLKDILENGNYRQTRNANTLSLFGKSLTFNLIDEFPLLTTKKMFLRGIFEELVWFLRGQTDSKILENKKVNIWKWNTSEEFLKKVGLEYQEGDIGNMYGFQWRHNGIDYDGYDKDYSGKGFDQIEYCLNLLKKDKYSRRILMSTYSPYNAHSGVLYPCHGITVQWYVRECSGINYLSCHMYQRSADMFLGVPFNISSYSLLTYMFCEVLNNDINYEGLEFKPDKLVISFGDVHIYDCHIDQVKEQISRKPFTSPKISFNKKLSKLNDFEWEDVKLDNYQSHKRIKANMVA